MSERPHKKNHTPPGTPPRKPRALKPGRGRPAKHYNAVLRRWDGDGGLWQSAYVKCGLCGHRWVAVLPIETVQLECPECGHMTPTSEAAEA